MKKITSFFTIIALLLTSCIAGMSIIANSEKYLEPVGSSEFEYQTITNAVELADKNSGQNQTNNFQPLNEGEGPFVITLPESGDDFSIVFEDDTTVELEGTFSFSVTISEGRDINTLVVTANNEVALDPSTTTGDSADFLLDYITEDITIEISVDMLVFTVTFKNWNGDTIGSPQEVEYGSSAVAPANPTKQATAQYTYTFNSWDTEFDNITENLTVTATYTETVNQYTYTFYDEDGTTVLKSETVDYGTTIVAPEEPTKPATAEFAYNFTGWSPEVPATITDDITFTAVYSSTVNQYTYTFYDEDGTTVLKSETVDYGATIVAPANPTKQATAQYTFTFANWDKTVPTTITDDITFTAVYSSTLNKYTVTFKNWNGDTIGSPQEVEYGSSAVAPANPTRAKTQQHTYTFNSWDTEFDNITENLTVTATYTETVNQYTYTFYDEDGKTVLKSETVDYGATIVAPANPTKPATAEFAYNFTGWSPEVPATITDNVTFTATYSETVNKYTVTFIDWDGNTIESQEVEYGSDATAPADPTRTGYTFTGWVGSFVNITQNTEITAGYTINTYTVTLPSTQTGYTANIQSGSTSPTDYNTSFSFTISLATGYSYSTAIVKANGTVINPVDNVYTISNITTNQVITIEGVTLNTYTVTFNLNGGTLVSGTLSQTITHGGSATAPTLSRTGYTFSNWDSTLTNIISNKSINANWNINSYTITFVSNGGNSVASITENFDTTITAPANPTYTGYVFVGWFVDNNTFNNPFTFNKMPAQNTTLYAKWNESGDTPYKVEHYQQNLENDDYAIITTDNFTGVTGASVTATANNYIGFNVNAGSSTTTANVLADGSLVLKIYYDRNIYTVKFVDWDNTEIDSQEIKFGGSATAPEEPTKPATAEFAYNFTGWSPEVPATITDNVTFTATYSETVNKYTYTFYDEDGKTVLKSETVDYGATIVAPANPTKQATAQYTFTFANWDKTVPTTITDDITFTAVYSSTVNKYTYTFYDEDGTTVLKSETVDYGATIVAPANPTKQATAEFAYNFTGWSPEVPVTITDNVTFTAVYSSTVNQYTYTFYDEDGTTVLKSETVDYGTTIVAPEEPTKPATAQYTFTFANWDKTVPTTITDDITFTAVYSSTVNKYTYTFYDEDGTTVLKSETVDYGATIVAPANPTKQATAQYTFTFANWDKTVPATITDDITFTAAYSSTINKYTVTFKDWDENTIESQEVEYGSDATAPADPTREATAQYSYTFIGWLISFENITSDLVVDAVYSQAINSYTVNFIDHEGNIIDTQTVKYGSEAAEPELPTREGYTFIGWDKTLVVTGDTELTAVWEVIPTPVQPDTDKETDKPESNSAVVWIIIGVAVLIAAGIGVVVFVFKKPIGEFFKKTFKKKK